MNRRVALFTPIFLILSGFALAQVQTTSAITGTIADQVGGVLPGVTVVVRNQETGVSRTVVTNDVGFYNVQSLKPGTYSVTASLDGFKTGVVRDRELQVAIPAQVNSIFSRRRRPSTVWPFMRATGLFHPN